MSTRHTQKMQEGCGLRKLSAAEQEVWERGKGTDTYTYDALQGIMRRFATSGIHPHALAYEYTTHASHEVFELFYAPHIVGIPPLAMLMRMPRPDPYLMLSTWTLDESPYAWSNCVRRLKGLIAWGYIPMDPALCMHAFLNRPACFVLLLNTWGHLVVPDALMRIYMPNTRQIATLPYTQAEWIRSLGVMHRGYYDPVRIAAVQYVAQMARATHLKNLTCVLARKRGTLVGRCVAQVLRNYDWRACALALTSRSPHLRQTLWSCETLEGVLPFCRNAKRSKIMDGDE